MVNSSKLAALYKGLFVVCFILLLIVTLTLLLWVSFALLASGIPLTKNIEFRELILVGMLVSVLAYFKWPWVAAAVGWIDVGMIVVGVFAWEEPSWQNSFVQFSFDIVFFIASQAGLGFHLARNRLRENSQKQVG